LASRYSISNKRIESRTPVKQAVPEVPIWLDHVVLKAVAHDKPRRFETAEELLLALELGAPGR
jgi:hypothetical protein